MSCEPERQLPLLPAKVLEELQSRGARREQAIGDHGSEFARRLVAGSGYSENYASTLARAMEGMARSTGAASLTDFVRKPDVVAAALRSQPQAHTRHTYFLAVDHFLRLHPEAFPPGARQRLRGEILKGFPGRLVPQPHLEDRDLGGSKEQVRVRPPLHLQLAEQIVLAAQESASPRESARDVCLLALLFWSGLPSGCVVTLLWQQVVQLFEEEQELGWFEAAVRGRAHRIVVHRSAIERLRDHWRVSGEPTHGPVFARVGGSLPLSDAWAKSVVDKALVAAGMPPVDRRHLHAPFALWLLDRDMEKGRVARGFGYPRVRELENLVRFVEEAQAQRRSTEALILANYRTIAEPAPFDVLHSPLASSGTPWG